MGEELGKISGNMTQQSTRHTGSGHHPNHKKEPQAMNTSKVYHRQNCELEEVTITCDHDHEEEHEKKGEQSKGEHGKAGGGKREAEKQPDGTFLLEVCANGDKEPEEAGGVTIPETHAGISTIRGLPTVGDKLKLKAEVDHPCREHPVWVITEAGGKTHTFPHLIKLEHEFVCRSGTYRKGVLGIFWLRSVKPRVYKVVCTAHHGSKTTFVHAYPTVESKLEVDTREQGGKADHAHSPEWVEHLEAARDKIKKVFTFLEKWTGKDTVDVKQVFEGSLYMTNYWQENKASNKVDWKGELGLDMVFLDMEVDIPIPNPTFLASRAIKFVERVSRGKMSVEFGLFFGVEGTFSANPHFEWTNDDIECKSGDLSAKFTIMLIAKAEVRWKGNVASLKFDIHTTLTFKGKPKMIQGPQVEVEVILNVQPLGGRIQVDLRKSYHKRYFKHISTWVHGVPKTKEYHPPDFTVEFFKATEHKIGTYNLLPPSSG